MGVARTDVRMRRDGRVARTDVRIWRDGRVGGM